MVETRGGLAALLVLLAVACCDPSGNDRIGADTDRGDTALSKKTQLRFVSQPLGAAAATETVTVEVELTDTGGTPLSDVEVVARVVRGGGTLDADRLPTDADGHGTFSWQLGPAPVVNEIALSAGGSDLRTSVVCHLDEPWTPEPFGDLDAFLVGAGIEGSTEDLVFDGGDRMILGVPGGLVSLDPEGQGASLATSGDEIGTPLGLAFDDMGALWVADSGRGALLRVGADGAVSTVLAQYDGAHLELPNDLAFGPDGALYLTDSCRGLLLRVAPDTGVVGAAMSFDVATEGGPNGVAYHPEEGRLYVTTENTALLCGHTGVQPDARVAGLFAIELTPDGFGQRSVVTSNFAVFGDGVGFDADGNLYAIFDQLDGVTLTESSVWIRPAGQNELVRFLSVSDRILANLAFGEGAFDSTTLYLARLSVPLVTPPEARGAEAFHVGIPGPVSVFSLD